ncbi:helix-turn-helix domain protein [Actinosynnema mirum DSM 43827]|uniref:Helix-turn-helix domain protein n=1 Tax=Actinosynnema mirum (strain ATCC 29888 / DSM 43827 / JCM 3225 / NBRC 14064 / NCIMB 13271 / NRRL B-12336 / IMRU 3971 / 101) TaxID=446462 RepID=C6W9D4_ACTMD|nr:helix-turn-helix domain protein [Actinosynnema mirum DSM 43827]
MSARELAGFLRARRESLGPAQVGLRRAPSTRTPGLRREEVAGLAGVTVNYYERVEQGRAPHPSPQVLDALGAALRLTGAEREHLARLAGHAPVGEEPEPGVPEAVRTLLDGLGATPAYAVTPALDVVAWNAAAVALFTDFGALPARERGLAALSRRFGGTLCGEVEPGAFAERAAADLRAAAVRFPGLGAARVAEEFGGAQPGVRRRVGGPRRAGAAGGAQGRGAPGGGAAGAGRAPARGARPRPAGRAAHRAAGQRGRRAAGPAGPRAVTGSPAVRRRVEW